MSDYRPPAPVPPAKQASLIARWIKGRRCTISHLPEKSYTMKLGQIRLPGHHFYPVCEPSLARRILVEQWRKFPKSDGLIKALGMLVGDGLLITNGEQWERQRRMVDLAFSTARLQSVFPLMLAATESLKAKLDALPDGGVLRADEEMTRAAADIIFRTIFSRTVEELDGQDVFTAFGRYQEAATGYWVLSVSGLPSFLSLNRFKAAREARAIRAILTRLVKEPFERYRRGEASDKGDIISALIGARDPKTGSAFDLKELVDQVAVLFFAGHETSASALAWAVYLLAACPHMQERMREEAMSVYGDRPPEYGDLKHLKFARDVFRETLRLYPPIGFLLRQASETSQMRDKTVPEGSAVAVCPWLMHRHRTYWERPDIFDPDRFSDEATKESVRTAYLPFSLGPRVCLGAAFAMQEATLILSSLVRHYRFEAIPEDEPKPIGRLTIRSEDGIRVRVYRRN